MTACATESAAATGRGSGPGTPANATAGAAPAATSTTEKGDAPGSSTPAEGEPGARTPAGANAGKGRRVLRSGVSAPPAPPGAASAIGPVNTGATAAITIGVAPSTAAPDEAGATTAGPPGAPVAQQTVGPGPRGVRPAAGFALSANGAYAARLTTVADSCFPERWTLDGPEPYAVPLPLQQPEEPDAELAALDDGRVLIHRRVAGQHSFALLYPTGPGTGSVPLGTIDAERLTLLPPCPDGGRVYALTSGARGSATGLWLVVGGGFGPEHVLDVPGRCSGGVWLDRAGGLLALDQEIDGGSGGRAKTVAVDLRGGGRVSPLLQIAAHSDDRLLLADPDSGLLVIRSDAPGEHRLGWGVLGSSRPVRFPECLRPVEGTPTPFAVQPGQVLMPENCAVALRIDAPGNASWLGIWRPTGRRLFQLPAPPGWLPGAGLWTQQGVLRLPYATAQTACGVAALTFPEPPPDVVVSTPAEHSSNGWCEEPARHCAHRPVPLQQAPLTKG
ncbi:hypothetical protein [Streptomyces sp. NPDC006879]|uniref:hypothetical protein n=1 Tax=Streptomyces sp. NPDC006879 TaxID=3364767 RepID=UPI00367A6CB2